MSNLHQRGDSLLPPQPKQGPPLPPQRSMDFETRLEAGREAEFEVGRRLLHAGLIVEVPLRNGPDRGDIFIHRRHRNPGWATRMRIEVKGVSLEYRTQADVPRYGLFVDRVDSWERAQTRIAEERGVLRPAAFISLSIPTGIALVIPISSFAQWTIEEKDNELAGKVQRFYAAPPHCLRTLDELIQHLRKFGA
jgi:hypothetical protein